MNYYVLGLLFLISACSKENTSAYSESCTPVVNDSELFNTPSKEDFTINKITYHDGCLEINATYGGGCEQFVPQLVWNGQEGLSLPPFFDLKLYTHVQDNCKALVTKTWSYNLEALSNAPEKTLNIQNKSLTIKD